MKINAHTGCIVHIHDAASRAIPQPRHAVIALHFDGSGSISIYYAQKLHAEIHTFAWEQWELLRSELNRMAIEHGRRVTL